MPILVCIEHSDSLQDFPECSIFYTDMSFKLPNIAMKCSRSFFSQGSNHGDFPTSAEIISMPNIKY